MSISIPIEVEAPETTLAAIVTQLVTFAKRDLLGVDDQIESINVSAVEGSWQVVVTWATTRRPANGRGWVLGRYVETVPRDDI